jgi:hypothetical protein
MRQISIMGLRGLVALVLTAGAAGAQDLTAGKTPAELFSSDCSACHATPNGFPRKYNIGPLTGFLRAHYTTKRESAGALAKYVMEFAALPPMPAPPTTEAVLGGRSPDDLKGRRRTINLSGDGEKSLRRRSESNKESPLASGLTQPSAVVEAAPQETAEPRNAQPARGRERSSESPLAAKLNDYAGAGTALVHREETDLMARLRAYAASGAGPQEAAAEASKTASDKSRRR